MKKTNVLRHVVPCTKYDALVLSGGGTKGLSMLGATGFLKKNGYLDNVNLYVGTSIGAIIATAIAYGLDPDDIFDKRVLGFKYCPDVDISLLDKAFGLDSGANFDKWLSHLFPAALTFESLFQSTKCTVVIVATNLNKRHAEYFSRLTTPTMSIRLALRISCSVPVYFAAVTMDGMMYTDGAVTDNFAVDYAIEMGAKKMLGIRFKPQIKPPNSKWAFDSFVGALLESAVVRRIPNRLADILDLDAGSSTQPLNFRISKGDMVRLHREGAEQAAAYMKKNV
jgi:predicted acylesterase/phospholipase RssA